MVIYIDVLIFLNFVVNYCFMKLIYLLFNEKINIKRLILSSLVSILLLFSFLFNNVIYNVVKIFGGLLLIFITFKYSNKKRFIIMCSLYYLLQFSFIGVLNIFNIKGYSVLIFLLLICLLVLIYSKKNTLYNKKNYKIVIGILDKEIELEGFLDTGNNAICNNKPIIFLDKKYYNNKLIIEGITNVKTINGIECVNCYKPSNFYIIDNNKKISKDVLISFTIFNDEINCLLNNILFT